MHLLFSSRERWEEILGLVASMLPGDGDDDGDSPSPPPSPSCSPPGSPRSYQSSPRSSPSPPHTDSKPARPSGETPGTGDSDSMTEQGIDNILSDLEKECAVDPFIQSCLNHSEMFG